MFWWSYSVGCCPDRDGTGAKESVYQVRHEAVHGGASAMTEVNDEHELK